MHTITILKLFPTFEPRVFTSFLVQPVAKDDISTKAQERKIIDSLSVGLSLSKHELSQIHKLPLFSQIDRLTLLSSQQRNQTTIRLQQAKENPRPIPASSASSKRDEFPVYIGTPQMKELHRDQSKRFRRWNTNKQWSNLHNSTAEWWKFMFPTDDVKYSGPYAVTEHNVKELLESREFVDDYRKSAEILGNSWGWNLSTSRPLSSTSSDQKWSNSPERLYVVGKSLVLFEQYDLFNSLVIFAQRLDRSSLVYNDINVLDRWETENRTKDVRLKEIENAQREYEQYIEMEHERAREYERERYEEEEEAKLKETADLEEQRKTKLTKQGKERADAANLLIGKGGYGCIYGVPGLSCTNSDTSDKERAINAQYHSANGGYVTKLLLKSSAESELIISKVLQQIDPTNKWFIYLEPNSICTVSLEQVLSCTSSKIQKHIEKQRKKDGYLDLKEFGNYSMVYGGVSYEYYIGLLTSADLSTIDLKDVIKDFIVILKALQVLHSNNIVHRDMSFANVLMSTTDAAPRTIRIIDFGLSGFTFQNENDWTSILNFFKGRTFHRWPPEFLALSHADVKEIYKHLVNETVGRNRRMLWMDAYPKYSVYTALDKKTLVAIPYSIIHPLVTWIVNKQNYYFGSLSRMQSLSRFVKKQSEINEMLKKADVFMFCEMCLNYWNRLKNRKENPIFIQVRQLLIKGIHPLDPDRPDLSVILSGLVVNDT